MTDHREDLILDQAVVLWAKVREKEDEADSLETFAKEARRDADDLAEAAEALVKPLLEEHPDWFEALMYEYKDPRQEPAG